MILGDFLPSNFVPATRLRLLWNSSVFDQAIFLRDSVGAGGADADIIFQGGPFQPDFTVGVAAGRCHWSCPGDRDVSVARRRPLAFFDAVGGSRPCPSLQKRWRECAFHVHQAHDIQVDLLLPLLEASRFYGIRQHDPRVVHHDVDPPELLYDVGCGAIDSQLLSYINLPRISMSPGFAYAVNNAVKLVLSASEQGNVCSTRSECFRRGFADSAGCAGDDGRWPISARFHRRGSGWVTPLVLPG